MPLSLTNPETPIVAERPSTRIAALDWTKGALVVCMVIYHAINYSAFRTSAFRFLAFLPPSFILIAGFLVGQVYAKKYDLRSWQPYLRLATRGLKLFVLFTVLNALHCVGIEHGFVNGLGEFAERSSSIYLSGNGRLGVFEVILPIAYFLLLAPVLLWMRARASFSITIAASVIFLLSLGLAMNGQSYKNLELLSAGIIGMAFGLIRQTTIDRLASRWIPVILIYLLYRYISYQLGEIYPVQILAATVSVLLLYCCGQHLNPATASSRPVILLGQYSLLGYLGQIAILQILVKLAGGLPTQVSGVVAVSAIGMVLTYGLVRVVHELRQRSRAVAASYKLVFA